MCGITGIICKKEKLDLRAKIIEMTNVLKNRGPDGEGYFEDRSEGVYLGHRRLSIIDLSEKANQPMFNEDKNLVLVFNGEIYNYIELRDELLSKGHIFSSQTDSEVLLHGWEEWGVSLLDKLNGMFAFCIYDKVKNETLLVRDHIGIKPLYYLDSPDLFAFASEARAFYPLRNSFSDLCINERILEQSFLFQFVVDREATIYHAVKKLPAGHFLKFKNSKFEIKPYWRLQENSRFNDMTFSNAVEECDAQINRIVKWQLRSDVPVGILLSGGLDSSLVTAVAKKNTSIVNTYTAAFNHKLDERTYARRCAQSIGTNHTEFNIDPLSINNRIEEIIKYFDDLSSFDGAIFTVYLMAEKIREYGVKVLLVGEGSDEIFGGYSWFGLSQFPFYHLPRLLRNSIYHYALSRQYSGRGILKHIFLLDKIIKSFGEDDIFRQISRFEVMFQLPNHLLMKVDRATMAHSLEARVPLLDKELVEFAFSLPQRYKLKGRAFDFFKTNEKLVLREVAKRYLPQLIYSRKKRGFSIPMELVLKSNKDKVRDYVLNHSGFPRRFFSAKELESLFEFKNSLYSPQHKQKEFLLWRLFLLEVWRQKVYNN